MSDYIDPVASPFIGRPRAAALTVTMHLSYTPAALAELKSSESAILNYVAGVPLPGIGDSLQVGGGNVWKVSDRVFTYLADRVDVHFMLDVHE